MKKIFMLVVLAGLISCNKEPGYSIKINVADLAGNQINLGQVNDNKMVTIDSVVLDSMGSGELSGLITTEEMMYLIPVNQRRNFKIFMGNYNYQVNGSMPEINITADAGPQIDFRKYLDKMQPLEKKQQEILDEYYKARGNNLEEDSLNLIIEKYYAIEDDKNAVDSLYIENNPASIISVYLIRNSYYRLDADKLETSLSRLDENLHQTSYYKFLSEHLEKMKSVAVGEKYVDFELPDQNGQMIKLSDLAGKGVLLIDFWASWCGPCRRANPGVVEIYNELHDKGFDILGVSLDNGKQEWLKAIEDDGLTWTHISDIQGWNCAAAKKYAVSSIPHTVLLDKDGTIVAKNLEKDELKAKIIELLND